MKNEKILVVSEHRDASAPYVEALGGCRLEYSFTEASSPDGLSAWEYEDAIEVSAKCSGFVGVYRQQALNRIFAKRLLRDKPSLVVIVGLNGASVDLIRVAAMMGVTVYALITDPAPSDLGERERTWLAACLAKANKVYLGDGGWEAGWSEYGTSDLELWAPGVWAVDTSLTPLQFNYGVYEFCLRDHPLLMVMQEQDVEHFESCSNVLDVGCGAGLFLQLLKERGINAYGVERDKTVATYGQNTGLDIKCDDALKHLQNSDIPVDGIYCSHFVEHLPIEAVEVLIEGIARRVSKDGVAVLTFPDPESIRSQLLGFWRDPEHVRFYHPELIKTIASVHGLECEWSSYDEQSHSIYSFTEFPEPIEQPNLKDSSSISSLKGKSWWLRLLSSLGVVTQPDIAEISTLKEQVKYQQQTIEQLTERTEKLWQVNQTWAWNDNVTLRFRKRQ